MHPSPFKHAPVTFMILDEDCLYKWYGPNDEIICEATGDFLETAEFFGYTTEQFADIRAKIQADIIIDRRRQLEVMEAVLPPVSGDGPTFKSALTATVILLGFALAIIFFSR